MERRHMLRARPCLLEGKAGLSSLVLRLGLYECLATYHTKREITPNYLQSAISPATSPPRYRKQSLLDRCALY
jgi:hypothetical protein